MMFVGLAGYKEQQMLGFHPRTYMLIILFFRLTGLPTKTPNPSLFKRVWILKNKGRKGISLPLH